MDLEYIRQRSVLRDLALLIQTVPAVLSRKGARLMIDALDVPFRLPFDDARGWPGVCHQSRSLV